MFLQRMRASKKSNNPPICFGLPYVGWQTCMFSILLRVFIMQRFRVTICGVANHVSTLQSLFNMFCVAIPEMAKQCPNSKTPIHSCLT